MNQQLVARLYNIRFWIVCLMFAVTIGLSANPVTHHHLLTAAQQSNLYGGSERCDFAGGLGTGLGIAGLFGCAVCAGASLAIGIGMYFAC